MLFLFFSLFFFFSNFQGILSSSPLSLPGRDQLNIAMFSGILAGAVALASSGDISGMLPALGAGSVVAALLGAHATASIGERGTQLLLAFYRSHFTI